MIKYESVHGRPCGPARGWLTLRGRLGNGTRMGSRETQEQEQSLHSPGGEGCSECSCSPWEEAQALQGGACAGLWVCRSSTAGARAVSSLPLGKALFLENHLSLSLVAGIVLKVPPLLFSHRPRGGWAGTPGASHFSLELGTPWLEMSQLGGCARGAPSRATASQTTRAASSCPHASGSTLPPALCIVPHPPHKLPRGSSAYVHLGSCNKKISK